MSSLWHNAHPHLFRGWHHDSWLRGCQGKVNFEAINAFLTHHRNWCGWRREGIGSDCAIEHLGPCHRFFFLFSPAVQTMLGDWSWQTANVDVDFLTKTACSTVERSSLIRQWFGSRTRVMDISMHWCLGLCFSVEGTSAWRHNTYEGVSGWCAGKFGFEHDVVVLVDYVLSGRYGSYYCWKENLDLDIRNVRDVPNVWCCRDGGAMSLWTSTGETHSMRCHRCCDTARKVRKHEDMCKTTASGDICCCVAPTWRSIPVNRKNTVYTMNMTMIAVFHSRTILKAPQTKWRRQKIWIEYITRGRQDADKRTGSRKKKLKWRQVMWIVTQKWRTMDKQSSRVEPTICHIDQVSKKSRKTRQEMGRRPERGVKDEQKEILKQPSKKQ